MSNKSIKPQKRASKERSKKAVEMPASKEWPVVVYMWAIGLAVLGYLIGETVFRVTRPHPFHWLLGLIGGILGISVGWLWYLWRGDVF